MISDRIMILSWWLSVSMILVISCLTLSETFKLYQFPTPFHNTMSGSIADQTISESIKNESDKMEHDFEQFANDIFNEFKKRLPKSGNTWEMDPIIRHLLLPAFLQARALNAQEKYHGWGG